MLDTPGVAKVAHDNGVPLIVDNTIATPYLIQPDRPGCRHRRALGHQVPARRAIAGVIVRQRQLRLDHFPGFTTPDPSYHGVVFAARRPSRVAAARPGFGGAAGRPGTGDAEPADERHRQRPEGRRVPRRPRRRGVGQLRGAAQLAVARAGEEAARPREPARCLRAGRWTSRRARRSCAQAAQPRGQHRRRALAGDPSGLDHPPAAPAEEPLATDVPGLWSGWPCRESTTSWRTWSAVSPPPGRWPTRTLRTSSGRGGLLTEPDVTLSDERTLHQGEVGVVDVGPLTLENGASTTSRSRCSGGASCLCSRPRQRGGGVPHALTGDSHITGPAGSGHPTPGWYQIGEPIDTNRWCAVATNVLGGCRGSAGPSSLARDGKPWGSRFPLLTVRDQVAADVAALAALGITEVAAVIGGSMGGARALEWMVGYPERVRAGLVLAAGPRATADQIGTQSTRGSAAIVRPELAGRGLPRAPRRGPETGLGLARRFASHLPRRGGAGHRFGNDAQGKEDPLTGGRYAVQYLEYQGAAGQAVRRGQLRGTPRDPVQPRRRPRTWRSECRAALLPGAGRGRRNHLRPALPAAAAAGTGRPAAGCHEVESIYSFHRRLPGRDRGGRPSDPADPRSGGR